MFKETGYFKRFDVDYNESNILRDTSL